MKLIWLQSILCIEGALLRGPDGTGRFDMLACTW